MNQQTKDDQKAREVVAEALRRPRYEVIPLKGAEEQVAEHVPKEIKLTVTASPKKGIESTMELAELLAKQGYETAPHLSARLIKDEAHLEDILHRLRASGIREAFVVAGDAEEPAGKFEGASELLAAMVDLGHDLDEVGITGYPESHPFISDAETIKAMYEKEPYATYIVSQICFDTEVIAGWVRRVRRRGVELPIYVGMPGAVSRQKLMRISRGIGLGESARFLKKYSNWFLRFFLPGGYSPDRLIEGLTPSLTDPQSKVLGFHIYTFNEVDKTEAWRRESLERIGCGVKIQGA
jgi:methylenetetrahydrofolate reductase (NADPH)